LSVEGVVEKIIQHISVKRGGDRHNH
jgi:hypothetical protein